MVAVPASDRVMVWSLLKVGPAPVLTVTVAMPPPSRIDGGSADRVSSGTSLSVIDTVAAAPEG